MPKTLIPNSTLQAPDLRDGEPRAVRPRVLMVTGAYHPETSGASLQCRQLAQRLAADTDFVVLTTTTSRTLPSRDTVDGVHVSRVRVDPTSHVSKAGAMVQLTRAFLALRRRFDLVHLHGFSQKTLLVMALARVCRKRVLIKLTSVGHDDGVAMKTRGGLRFVCYKSADVFVGVSPRHERAHQEAGLPPGKFRLVPNGVDLDRFHPASPDERRQARARLGLEKHRPLVLFVGFFSHEKRPDLLYDAWASLAESGLQSTLVLVGATSSTYYEIDPRMASSMRADAARRGLSSSLVFVEHTSAIEEYYRAADVFALPTLREGMPNAVLEAMASGVPPVVTRLEGITDSIVEDGTGILVPPNDSRALADALAQLITDPDRREALGRRARALVARRFAADATARQMLEVYRELLDSPR
ncbi:MAG: glycosyltransferase family 4 protein [Acidobacteriota bacterium]